MMIALLLTLLSYGVFGVNVDDGVGIDPHGGVRASASSADAGSCIDPSGRCGTASLSTDEGTGIDPHGGR